jgi:hypothetical protein
MTQEVTLPGQGLQQIRTFASHRFRNRHNIAFLLAHRETKRYSRARTQPAPSRRPKPIIRYAADSDAQAGSVACSAWLHVRAAAGLAG